MWGVFTGITSGAQTVTLPASFTNSSSYSIVGTASGQVGTVQINPLSGNQVQIQTSFSTTGSVHWHAMGT